MWWQARPWPPFSGVVPYDLGKRLVGGGFERNKLLYKPPDTLSINLRKLQAQNLMFWQPDTLTRVRHDTTSTEDADRMLQ